MATKLRTAVQNLVPANTHVAVGMANFGAAGLITMFLVRVIDFYGHTNIPSDIVLPFATMLGMFFHFGVTKWGFPSELDGPVTDPTPVIEPTPVVDSNKPTT